MAHSRTGSSDHRRAIGSTLAWALLFALVASAPARAQTDLTDPSLPHTADSVLFDFYAWYDPAHVSDNQLGLEGVSWHSGDERTGQIFPHWVQIDFGEPRTVLQLKVLAYSETADSNLRLKDFRFEGSQNGVTFTPLHASLLRYSNQHTWQSFDFENSTAYRYYRLYGLSNWGGYNGCFEQMIIEEWEMFGEASGACCFPSGACLAGTAAACAAAGGEFQGAGTDCDPNLCQLIAAEPMHWGSIKSLYR